MVVHPVPMVPLPPPSTHPHQDPTELHNNKDPHPRQPMEHLEEEMQDIKEDDVTTRWRTLAIMPLISCIYFCTSFV